MTGLLKRVVTEIEKLPADQQEAIAERILADLKDEQAWTASFSGTKRQQWDRLAQQARAEIASGDVVPLGDIFPAEKPQR